MHVNTTPWFYHPFGTGSHLGQASRSLSSCSIWAISTPERSSMPISAFTTARPSTSVSEENTLEASSVGIRAILMVNDPLKRLQIFLLWICFSRKLWVHDSWAMSISSQCSEFMIPWFSHNAWALRWTTGYFLLFPGYFLLFPGYFRPQFLWFMKKLMKIVFMDPWSFVHGIPFIPFMIPEVCSLTLWSLKCVHSLYDPWSVFIPFMIPEVCSSPLWSLKFVISSMIPEVCSWMRFAHGSVWSLMSVKLHRSCLYMHSWCFRASLKASLFSPLYIVIRVYLTSVKLHRPCLYMHSWWYWASLKSSLFSQLEEVKEIIS